MTPAGNRLGYMRCLAVATLAAMSIGAPAPALSTQEGGAVLLVAKRQFLHPLYGGSIVLARPIGDRRHFGFILNKPTSFKLGDVLPADEASPKVHKRVYLGGPIHLNVMFALIRRSDSPGRDSIEFADGLYLTTDPKTLQRLFALEPAGARFFIGAVLWRPGELEAELNRGLWYVRAPDADVVRRQDIEGLWEELAQRSELEAYFLLHGI